MEHSQEECFFLLHKYSRTGEDQSARYKICTGVSRTSPTDCRMGLRAKSALLQAERATVSRRKVPTHVTHLPIHNCVDCARESPQRRERRWAPMRRRGVPEQNRPSMRRPSFWIAAELALNLRQPVGSIQLYRQIACPTVAPEKARGTNKMASGKNGNQDG